MSSEELDEAPTITRLDKVVEGLTEETRTIFDRLFRFSISTGHLTVPDTFKEKIWTYFRQGDETVGQTVDRVSTQHVVTTHNNYTWEGALFNELRTCKPGNRPEDTAVLRKAVFKYIEDEHGKRPCDLCDPENLTPLDLPKRLKRNGHYTIANAAKYDAANGMVVFRDYNPLVFSEQDFSDWIDLASEWFAEMNLQNQELVHPFLIWNCLPRAGASLIHGHMHILLASSPYEGVETLRRADESYVSDSYFRDLAYVHEKLGLGFDYKERDVMAHLTPTKDKETMIVANSLEDLKEPTYKAIRCFIDDMGVFAFNLGLQMPPINDQPGWANVPYIARIVDRGNPLKHGTDFAGMELFASKVIGSDPFKVAETLRRSMEKS